MNELWNRFEQDKDYIEKKYQAPDYDPVTGLDNAAICAELTKRRDNAGAEPRMLVKAKAFDFVLSNTRIDAGPYDWFIGISEWGQKSIDRVMISHWCGEVLDRYAPGKGELMNRYNREKIWLLYVDYCHSVPDWDAVLSLGFPGLLARARRHRAQWEASGAMTREKADFFDAIEIEYTAILHFLQRLEQNARAQQDATGRCALLADCLHDLSVGAPKNIYEALQSIWLYFLLSEYVDCLQVRSFGNLDRVLFPYFQRDLAAGTFTEEQVRELFRYFLQQASAMHYYWGHPFYFGGTNADGSSAVNALSYLILDVYDKMGIYDPKLQIKVAPNTPTAFLNKALEMIRGGHNSIVFVGEPAIMRTMTHRGCTAEEARLCDVKGCYEVAVRGDGVGTASVHPNLPKGIELVLHNGVDPVSGDKITSDYGNPQDFATFDQLLDAYLKTELEIYETGVAITDCTDGHLAEINPCPMFSATIETSLKRAFDAYAGGAKAHTSEVLLCCPATAADSLTMLRKYVYEKKEFTLAQFKAMLDANWEGYEDVRRRMTADKDKYGNNREQPDQMLKTIVEFIAKHNNGRPNQRGGQYVTSLHCAKQFLDMGEKTGATPDGRRKGEEFSKNASPVQGMNDAGATALIESVLKLDAADFSGDLPVDVSLHPAAVSGGEGLVAMRALLLSYVKRGGYAIHFNVYSPETLRAAQQDPERYKDLQIRVCGWNVLFRNLSKAEQDHYIMQAEAHS